MSSIIEVEGLTKCFGKYKVLKEVNFKVKEGEFFSFLGPNGAGKSTTIDILCTFMQKNSGRVVIDNMTLGQSDRTIRSELGVVFQNGYLDPLLTVRENLSLRGGLYKLKGKQLKDAIEQAAQYTEIEDILDRVYSKLSGGQKRRVDISRALINTPKILILDEPTTGLDPQTRVFVWDKIKELQENMGVTVFLTTHYMEEATLANHIVIINKGEIVADGTPTEIKEKYTNDLLRIEPCDIEYMCNKLSQLSISYKREYEWLIVNISNTLDTIPLLQIIKEDIKNFEVINGTMDNAFINVIKQNSNL